MGPVDDKACLAFLGICDFSVYLYRPLDGQRTIRNMLLNCYRKVSNRTTWRVGKGMGWLPKWFPSFELRMASIRLVHSPGNFCWKGVSVRDFTVVVYVLLC